MRAFIAALLAIAVTAVDESGRTEPVGGWNYNKGGDDWGTFY